MQTEEIINAQRHFFESGKTLNINDRISILKKLKRIIKERESDINKALYEDLGKSRTESYMCEVGLVLSELGYMISHIKRWSRPKVTSTPLVLFHGKSYTVYNPYGVVLVMSPWNYPFMLTMEPLVGAIACGNCCVVKPSAYSPATSAVIKSIIEECFPKEYVTVIEGGRAENQSLLKQKFDYIFFTGGVNVGKEVMRNAADHTTPVTLELGGKSPCIIDETANLKIAAKKLAFGKILNCGQTCVAPDYILIDEKVEEEFVRLLKKYIVQMLGENPLENEEYVHMINSKHYERIMSMISKEKVDFGGHGNPETLKIEPTIIRNITAESATMNEEIFGPIIPIMTFGKIEEAFSFVKSRPQPLACYIFSEDKKTQRNYEQELAFGGGCINDTIVHIATSHLSFGGVGASGMGSYHGKKSFDTFTHAKSILKEYTWIDFPVRYAPYSRLKEKMLRIFLN